MRRSFLLTKKAKKYFISKYPVLIYKKGSVQKIKAEAMVFNSQSQKHCDNFESCLQSIKEMPIPKTHAAKAPYCRNFGDLWKQLEQKEAIGVVWHTKHYVCLEVTWKGVYCSRRATVLGDAHIRGILIEALIKSRKKHA